MSIVPSYGQSVIIRACGTRQALRTFETSVLSRNDNEYWDWDVDTPMYRDCEVEHLPSHDFSIAESRRGAICGAIFLRMIIGMKSQREQENHQSLSRSNQPFKFRIVDFLSLFFLSRLTHCSSFISSYRIAKAIVSLISS